MEKSRNDKAKILQSYFDGIINREEMIFLCEVGLIVPPIVWIYDTKEAEAKAEKHRELVEKVLGKKFPRIVWV